MSQMVWNSNHSEIITVASTGLDMAILGLHANASIFAKCLIDWHCLCLLAFRYPLASYGSCSFKIFSFDVPVLSFTAGRHRADPATTVRTKETTMSAALTTWRPIFGTIEPFRREMEDLMGRFFAEEERNGQLAKTWSPRLDVEETDRELLVKADLPGVDPKNVEVSVENGVLTVRGEKKEEKEEKKKNYHRVERFCGTFYRAVPLPTGLDAEKVTATSANGVVTIAIPKKPEAMPKKITVTPKG